MALTRNQKKPNLVAFSLFSDLVKASLGGEQRKVELIALSAIRKLRKEHREVADELSDLLARYSTNASSLRRTSASPPPPETSDGNESLIQFPNVEEAFPPIFSESLRADVMDFVSERNESKKLISAGLIPPRSILLKGPPGTGKTALAKYLAKELNLPLAVLDLASSMSSFLGKTGTNLRKSLSYGRSHPCVFLLDEFDAIAKRRDDATDVGELKRVVTVLLKELEDWSLSSILVAATNHPEMLDPAIERRFDIVLNIPLPGPNEREAILNEKLGTFVDEVTPAFIKGFSYALDGQSGSGIETLVHSSLRAHLMQSRPLTQCLCNKLIAMQQNTAFGELPKSALTELIVSLKNHSGMTVREIGQIFGKTPSTIQYHLKKKPSHA